MKFKKITLTMLIMTLGLSGSLDMMAAKKPTALSVPTIPASFAEVVKLVRPSVASVATTYEPKGLKSRKRTSSPEDMDGTGEDFFRKFFDGQEEGLTQRGLGSGVIIDASGYVLTNNHVVEKATTIKVELSDGREIKAKVVGTDPHTDLAVLKMEKVETYPVAQLGDSDQVEVGDWVVAVGCPFGFKETATHGIISAKGRDISREIGTNLMEDFFQTDAVINPGNSGGPLVSMKGEVIGINTAIQTNTGSYVGIGFAIPINLAKSIYQQLLKGGKVVRGWLGVGIQELTPELSENFGIKGKKGVVVNSVFEGGPADKGGLKNGDVITLFNGKKVENPRELQGAVALVAPGSDVPVVFYREGKQKTLTIQLGERDKGEASIKKSPLGQEDTEQETLGFSSKSLTASLREQYGLKSKDGVLVTRVDSSSPAYEAGLRHGDVIHEINKHKVMEQSDLDKAIHDLKAGGPVVLLVEKQGVSQYISFSTAKDDEQN